MSNSNSYRQKIEIAVVSSCSHSKIFICNISPSNESETLETEILHCLEGLHDRSITCIDWSDQGRMVKEGSVNCRIVSCGEDCRAIVWEYDQKSQAWRATQVILQHETNCFAPLQCCWDNDGSQFVLAMGGNHKSASLQVCSFDFETRQWVARHIGRRNIKSSVLCVAWKPNHLGTIDVVASGGCDRRCRLFSVSRGSNGKAERR